MPIIKIKFIIGLLNVKHKFPEIPGQSNLKLNYCL